jgi:hypothetical protein
MAYIIAADYLRIIQDANLQQIITNNSSVRTGAELSAQAEAISYLRQKYDVKKEFKDTNKWDDSEPYLASDRAYLDAALYLASNTYNLGALCMYSGSVYRCLDTTTGTFNLIKWQLLGLQYEIFYAMYPFPLFDLSKFYNVGDKIFWENKTYECLIQTPLISHEDGIQFYQIDSIPYANVFPNDPMRGSTYWTDLGDYSVPANTDILDTDFWSDSDNRDQQMVMYFADITLYHLHARIAPRNIPELRITRYQAAIDWLKMAAKGDITPNLPVLQPKQGGRIRFGSQVRNINSY